jgi:hypothetical protein
VTADAAVTLAWIAPDAPDAEQTKTLASWASAHGVKLVSPAHAKVPALNVDERVADDVERALDRARDAMVARDGDAVDRVLATAESSLRAHPELPQAAWQMAEVLRTRSARLRRIPPTDADAAERAWTRAQALDGDRVAGIGEEAFPSHPPQATLTLDGAPAGAEVWLDGKRASGAVIATLAGPHALVVAWDGAPVWATWIESPAGSSAVHVEAPAFSPCSSEDVGRATFAHEGIDADGVRCDAWVAAVPGDTSSSLHIATCAEGRCGSLLEWHVAKWTWTPPPPPPKPGWPAWATWGLVGAGAAVVTGVVVVAASALQHPASETRTVSGGLKVE